MRVVFHGVNAASFSDGFADLVGPALPVALYLLLFQAYPLVQARRSIQSWRLR